MVNQAELQERLRRARVASDFQDLVRQSRIDSRFLEELQQNPERQKEIEALLRAVLKDQFDRDDPRAKQVESLLREWSGKDGAPPQGFDSDLWKQLEETSKSSRQPPQPAPDASTPMNPSPDSGRAPSTGGDAPKNGQPPATDSPPNITNPFATPQRTGFEEQIVRWAQKFFERNPSLRDSNVMKSVIAELDRLRLREALQMDNGSSFGMQIAKGMEKLLPSQQFLDDKLRPMLNRLPRPELPNIQLPRIELPRPSLPSFDLSAPHLSAPSPGAFGKTVVVLLILAALILIGVRLYRMKTSGSLAVLGGTQPKTPLIRFDPHTPIRSRRDLIQAFERLAVHVLGVQAENWNHRAIATQLGGYSKPRRRAAGTLAQYYEMARYAPETESILPEWFGTAQREVAFLAEAPPA